MAAKREYDMKLEQTIIIARPVEEVFAYRSALENAAEWQRDVVTSELAAPGTPAIGTRGIEVRSRPNGDTEEWDLEITEFQQDRVLEIMARCGSVCMAERHVFVRDQRDTRYTLSLDIVGSSLGVAAVQRKIVETLMNLKWQLEGSKVRAD